MRRYGQSSLEYVFMFAAGLLMVLIILVILRDRPHHTAAQLVESGDNLVSEALSELQEG
ncbi:hypothetical protein [Thermococcus sp. LS1]|uniref:hypothetical protein n=1 Tax=Thermococcus sp. LS1 TaxID=1638259 RepID=UPI001438F609|nr:hypothetical protein [Thermococcus sp. LS1]